MENPKKLWSPSGVATMTIFFSFVVGGILYAHNAEKLGQVKSKWLIIGPLMLFAVVLSMLIFFDISATFSKYYDDIAKIINIAAAIIFYRTQKEAFTKFIAEGGTKASYKKPLLYSIIMVVIGVSAFFWLDDTVKLKAGRILETEKISVQVPENWDALEPEEEGILIELDNKAGYGSITMDNEPYFIGISNSILAKDEKPGELLQGTFTSIQSDIAVDPNFAWKNFTISEPVSEFQFKGYRAARGSFRVDENVLEKGEILNRIIYRVIVFTENDIYTIVFAPHDINTYQKEAADFQKFLDTLEFK